MKKIFILLGLVAIISLSGCGKNEITCVITSPKDGAEVSINDDLVITVDATDTKGIIATVIVWLGNEPFPAIGTDTYTVTIPSILLTLGEQTIKAVVVDKEGLQAETSISITITEGGGNNSDESPDFVTFADGKIPESWRSSTCKIDVAMGYDDDYSLRTDNPVASVVTTKTVNVVSYIEFYIRGGNYFDFYIDNKKAVDLFSTSVGNNWTKWIYVLEKGKHSFRWENTMDATIHIDAIKFAPAQLPKVATSAASNITSTSATLGGNVSDNGNNPVTARGVCWNTSENPTIENNKTTEGTGIGSFTSNLSELEANTLYYVRAYATNGVGTAYGEQITFTTLTIILPTVTTENITNITYSMAFGGGNVIDGGNHSLTARGVCWSTSQNPTIADSKTTNGSETGNFTSNITELNMGTTYYVRAYATSVAGTAYGEQISFTTKNAPLGEWVEINGVIWATRNVDMPGTFAANKESAGMFYQWNRNVGWSSTDPLISSNGDNIWNADIPTGTIWTEENDPCPAGWRVPTRAELESLIDAGSQWTSVNGVNGSSFGSGANSLFLPAAGLRIDGVLNMETKGYNWSSNAIGSSHSRALIFNIYGVSVSEFFRDFGFCVRCVAE